MSININSLNTLETLSFSIFRFLTVVSISTVTRLLIPKSEDIKIPPFIINLSLYGETEILSSRRYIM